MKKRILALLLAVMMSLGLSGCGDAEINEALVNGAIDVLAGMIVDEGTQDDASSSQNKVQQTTQVTTTAPVQTSTVVSQQTTTTRQQEKTTAATSQTTTVTSASTTTTQTEKVSLPAEDGYYYSAEDVALYLHTYGYLPGNFITKQDARALGWQGGSVEDYAPDCAIGGDVFGNREGLLPEARGRTYYECDIDTHGEDSRGAKRLVFSNDGLIYYTTDHYESFELLYGEE